MLSIERKEIVQVVGSRARRARQTFDVVTCAERHLAKALQRHAIACSNRTRSGQHGGPAGLEGSAQFACLCQIVQAERAITSGGDARESDQIAARP